MVDIYWIPIAGIVFGVMMVIVIVLSRASTRERQAKLRAEVQMKLIDRFGSADEFIRFVQSDEGRRFLGDAATVTRRSVAGGINSGIILGSIGVAFLLIAFSEHDGGYLIPAFLLLALGGGFFASAMISRKLAREMERNAGS